MAEMVTLRVADREIEATLVDLSATGLCGTPSTPIGPRPGQALRARISTRGTTFEVSAVIARSEIGASAADLGLTIVEVDARTLDLITGLVGQL